MNPYEKNPLLPPECSDLIGECASWWGAPYMTEAQLAACLASGINVWYCNETQPAGGIDAPTNFRDFNNPPTEAEGIAYLNETYPDTPKTSEHIYGVPDELRVYSVVTNGRWVVNEGVGCGGTGYHISWNGSMWKIISKWVLDITRYIECPSFACPSNTTFINGACEPDPYYEWCDETHTEACQKCVTLGCITSFGNPPSNCLKPGDQITLCFQWIPYDPNCDPDSNMEYMDVGISYGGDLGHAIHGPSFVRINIPAYTGCITVSIKADISPNGGTLLVIPDNPGQFCEDNKNGIPIELCGIDPDDDDYKEEIPPPGSGGGDSPWEGSGDGDGCFQYFFWQPFKYKTPEPHNEWYDA